MFFGRYTRMAEKVVRMLEECSAAVFEIYFGDKMKPYVELKRAFPDLREAEEYVEQHRYLDEEGEVLKPEEFLPLSQVRSRGTRVELFFDNRPTA
jgi:hypothetical protein